MYLGTQLQQNNTDHRNWGCQPHCENNSANWFPFQCMKDDQAIWDEDYFHKSPNNNNDDSQLQLDLQNM